jgi:malate dehydrogenase (oxaloacetate-decarboxylating)(NADP+)
VQFAPVPVNGSSYVTSQANNLYVFPAVGMAIYATQAKRVTDEMFIVAAGAVAQQVTDAQLQQGLLYPPQSNILDTELNTAAAVAQLVFDRGLAGVDRPGDIGSFVRAHAYKPVYPNLL